MLVSLHFRLVHGRLVDLQKRQSRHVLVLVDVYLWQPQQQQVQHRIVLRAVLHLLQGLQQQQQARHHGGLYLRRQQRQAHLHAVVRLREHQLQQVRHSVLLQVVHLLEELQQQRARHRVDLHAVVRLQEHQLQQVRHGVLPRGDLEGLQQHQVQHDLLAGELTQLHGLSLLVGAGVQPQRLHILRL